ncbi:MAG TPA: hypothetical protein VLG10_06295 [Methylomirabilota bacterium]|nr:hypothetical protein [Methylomirabilota bacterium]
MRLVRVHISLLALLVVALAGCASKEEWETWQSRPAHFASESHMKFSVRNRLGTRSRVTREDIATAREEGWWGRAITVSQEAILER